MRTAVLNLVLLAVLLALCALHWVVLPDASRRNWEFLPDMVSSPALAAQGVPPELDGHELDLRPPEGSMARGFIPFAYAATPEGALLAGLQLVNPVPADDALAAERGAAVYNNQCAVCHGAAGHGDGVVTLRGVPPPPSLTADHARALKDGQIYHVITLGQGNMAAYGSQVAREDRWKVIRHIRTLQTRGQQQTATVGIAPAAEPAEPAGGDTSVPSGSEEH